MSIRSLNRSGTLLIIAGLLIAIPMLFHPDDRLPDFALQTAWVPVHLLMGIGTIAALAGLALLYGGMQNRMTAFGRLAFGTSLLGTAFFIGLMFFVEATLFPALLNDPAGARLLGENGPLFAGPFGIAVMGSLAIISLGYILLAIYLTATRIISVLNGILFLGGPFAAFAPPLPYVAEVIGGVVLGIAITWLGFSVRNGFAHKALEEDIRVQDQCLTQARGHA